MQHHFTLTWLAKPASIKHQQQLNAAWALGLNGLVRALSQGKTTPKLKDWAQLILIYL
jgi:hypothetical protein